MNCTGCGVEINPTNEQVNSAVDHILESSLEHAKNEGGICPLCGHLKADPISQRKSVQFALLLACLIALALIAMGFRGALDTQRKQVANEVIRRMAANSTVAGLLGSPISVGEKLDGIVKQDETGWNESNLHIPVSGPKGEGIVHVVGGRGDGPWVFTTFEVDFAAQHKKVDMVSGKVVEYDPNGYVDIHSETATVPEYETDQAGAAAAPRMTGNYPCLFAAVTGDAIKPQVGECSMPLMNQGSVDRFEADLRYGRFVLRETDLTLKDVFDVPLTRTYASSDWAHPNHVHAFGRNSSHPFDITPLGSRNPYTYQFIALEDSDILYFDRISKGTGYADAVYQHTETSTKFYKATQRWSGLGWTTKLTDGSEIHFPESYNAKNMAQGAPTEILDGKGNRLKLVRDAQRNLQEIRTPHGHWIKFAYDDSSRIVRAEDDKGNWARYSYNSEGMLESVFLSSHRERHFAYEGPLMTDITDEKGQTLLENRYQDGILIGQKFGHDNKYFYEYRWSESRRYVDTATVFLPGGVKREFQMADFIPEIVRNTSR